MSRINLGDANPYVPPVAHAPHVRVETMLFSIVEPNPGFAVAYNDWYERDHQFDGGMCGEGWFSNRRWVATKRLKALRFPQDGAFADLTIGSLLQVYWRQAGYAQSSEKWALDQWVRLNVQRRIFTERRHFHSASYTHLSTASMPDERVPLELALMHPFRGLLVFMIDDVGDRSRAINDIECVARDTLMSATIPIVSNWEMLREPGQAAQRPPGTLLRGRIDQLLELAFVRDDPEKTWEIVHEYAAALRRTGCRVTFAAGFIPTIPGTTTYLDEL